ncbi:FAD-dependent thymidylate synthase [Plantactinospora sp. S1510]|uniref:Flavin-dependent thymidylate synthase n=1 Tax=Plantactinospora alkalitolerans TaxID=2789879 RepID=A0ABS0HAJ9_9ACTN|nr:FAD-dependent thymidylate synthase [Plantactinospora alkalitolerans]MBF9135189.1 FAD-dependent thymidylate synthase [Plantactinospora alkalitolerans]
MGGFETDAEGGQALAEAAGRACYASWRKPNPTTATNAGYLAHILDSQHLSVLEHGTVTFYFTGVSRSFTHELVRHRHFSYSQLSQRYVPEGDAAMVEPDVVADDAYLHRLFTEATEASVAAYRGLLHGLERKLAAVPLPGKPICTACGQPAELQAYSAGTEGYCLPCDNNFAWPTQAMKTARRKLARQAARAVLPNATETRIVVTGNYRAWRHFVAMRATEGADVEIRNLAVACLRGLQRIAPNVFADFTITALPDGTEVASSPHAERV